jgi:hypothetical protein
VNNVCDNALLAGYADGKKTITRDIIEDVIDTLDLTTNETTTTDPLELSGWPAARHMAAADGTHS